jgi:hypothetical protein
MDHVNYFITVMHHESKLSRYFGKLRWIGYLLYNWIRFYKWLMYALACVINILLLFFYQIGYFFGDQLYREIFLLGLIILGLSIYVMIIYGLRNVPVIWREARRKALAENPLGKWNLSNAITFLQTFPIEVAMDETFYYFTFALFTLIGLLYDHLFFIYQLTFIIRIELLKGVVSAVWLRRSQLVLTLILIILIFYYFSMVGFLWFPEQIPHQRCSKLYECVIITFDL